MTQPQTTNGWSYNVLLYSGMALVVLYSGMALVMWAAYLVGCAHTTRTLAKEHKQEIADIFQKQGEQFKKAKITVVVGCEGDAKEDDTELIIKGMKLASEASGSFVQTGECHVYNLSVPDGVPQ